MVSQAVSPRPTKPQPQQIAPTCGVRYRRNIFTDELEEVPSEGGGVHIIFRETLKYGMKPGRHRRKAWHNRVSRAMSIAPEQATPDRIARENEAAQRHGTGAYYTPDGTCHTGARDVENREMRRRGFQNNDAGWGDYAGR